MNEVSERLAAALARRYGDPPEPCVGRGVEALAGIAARGSQRRFSERPVDPALIRMVLAVAFAAPTKSDLQQRDVVVVTDPDLRAALNRFCGTQAWLPGAPVLLVICGNHRRQRRLHSLRGHPFVNDHLDAFFNAAVDGGVLLGACVTAAEAVGLGCCPISAIRNEPAAVSDLLALPDLVFPVATLAIGWPVTEPEISPRLPLSVTVHENRFDDAGEEEAVAGYDRRREAVQPYPKQRFVERFGAAAQYGWSEDKARQYAAPERADFGHFIRSKGFRLD